MISDMPHRSRLLFTFLLLVLIKKVVFYLQLESQTETGRILQKSMDKNNNKNRRPVKKKTKKIAKKTNKPVNPNHHYHLNLSELPFVAGKVRLSVC